MQTYYEKVLNRMRRSILLVAVAIVALLSVSAVAMGVTSTEGRNEGHAGKVAASDGLTRAAAVPTTTVFKTVTLTIPQGSGTKEIKGRATFAGPVRGSALALTGYKFDYISVDHHTDVIEVDLRQIPGLAINPPPKYIDFIARVTHADKNHDDSYRGSVTVTVIGNVQTP